MTKPISSDAASILSVLADIAKFQQNQRTGALPGLAVAVGKVPALIAKLPPELQGVAEAVAGRDPNRNDLSEEQRQLVDDIRQWSHGPA